MIPSKLARERRELFQPIDYFKATPAIEWIYRQSTRVPLNVGTANEETNSIITLTRARAGIQNGTSFEENDAAIVETDFNTIPENSETRFEIGKLGTFFASAVTEHQKLLEAIANLTRP